MESGLYVELCVGIRCYKLRSGGRVEKKRTEGIIFHGAALLKFCLYLRDTQISDGFPSVIQNSVAILGQSKTLSFDRIMR